MIEFRKFSLFESPKYQNIPRTIQNVFLNSKLDADFIKETIIRSMSDDEMAIDLNFNRNQVKEFEQEYKDVQCWTKPDKNGVIVVRQLADKVIATFHDLLFTQKTILTEREELNFAERFAREQIPLFESEILRHETEEKRVKRLQEDETKKYNAEHDRFIGDLRVITSKLSEIKQKKEHYEQIGIYDLVCRVEKRPSIIQIQQGLLSQREQLTKEQLDVVDKYRRLYEQLELAYRSFVMRKDEQLVSLKGRLAERKADVLAQKENADSLVLREAEEELQNLHVRQKQLQEQIYQQQQQKMKIRFDIPYQQEIDTVKGQLREAELRESSVTTEIGKLKNDAQRFRLMWEGESKDVDLEMNKGRTLLYNEIEKLEHAVQELSNKIESRKGSLVEWLEEHKTGWKENIGKVVDEDLVLYNREMKPQLVPNSSESFYGVKLDLSMVECSVLSPEELKAERQHIQAQIVACQDSLQKQQLTAVENKKSLERKYLKLVHEVSEKQHLLEAELLQLPNEMRRLKVELLEWQQKRDIWEKEAIAKVEEKINGLRHVQYELEQDEKQMKDERERKLAANRRKCQEKIKEFDKELDVLKQTTQKELVQKELEKNQEVRGLKQAEQNELSGRGVDEKILRELDTKIATINNELKFIEDHRQQVYNYQKDKSELFDHEEEYKESKKKLQNKLNGLDERFERLKNNHLQQLQGIHALLRTSKDGLEHLQKGLDKCLQFRNNVTLCPPALEILGERKSLKSCDELVDLLTSNLVSIHRKIEDFKKSINRFNGFFSAKNTFNFRQDLISDEDYKDFASNLCDFVENDKISDYQNHISEQYLTIIRRVSKEVGDLTRNSGEIEKIISAVNRDFERKNFAGVIKEIALRAEKSSDKLMQLLLSIKAFNDENQFSMGEMNLFSEEDHLEVNHRAVKLLMTFVKLLLDEPSRKQVALADTFKLEFRIKENDNDTQWIEKISNVGSDGTDVLVKAMVNIMLINVFKERITKKNSNSGFMVHCMMDEIGKLHPSNVKGILDFANARNIWLVNSSPTTYNVGDYRYTYLLKKDTRLQTEIIPLVTSNR